MGVTNNFYLLSKSRIKKKDIEKIEIKIVEISKKLFRRIANKNDELKNNNLWTLEEIKDSLKIEFQENSWFIGDKDYFFFIDENDEIIISEFTKDEIAEYAICPSCDFNLYQKVLKSLVKKFKNQKGRYQTNSLFNENQEGIQCSNCGLIIEKDKLTGRKIIGNFRIELPRIIFEYFSWKEITEYFNSDDKSDFYIEHYQYP